MVSEFFGRAGAGLGGFIGGLFTDDEPEFFEQPGEFAGIPTTGLSPATGSPTTGGTVEDAIAAQIAAYEAATGATFAGVLPDGSFLFNTVTGDQVRLVNAGGTLVDPSLAGEAGLGSGGGGGGGGGVRVLSPQEQETLRLQNALLQRELETNPNLQLVQNERTGQTLLLDTQTGESRPIGQFGFAQIDPERDFALREAGVTGFLGGTPTLERELGTAAEDRLRAALELQRQVSQGNLNLSAADQDRLRRALEAEIQSINQQADFGRFDRMTDLLRNPADFLARAFTTRGVESPTGQITQADLINALRESIRDVEDPSFQLDIADIFQRNQLSPLDFTMFSGGQQAVSSPAPAPAPSPTVRTGPSTTAVTLPDGSVFDAFGGDPVRNQQVFEDRLARGADPDALAEFQRIAEQQAAARPDLFPGFQHGGVDTMSPVVRVGEPVGGKPNPEFIFKRPGDPMVVVPARRMEGRETAAQRNTRGRQASAPRRSERSRIPGAQTGGVFGVNAPTTQEELRSLEERFRPPAITSILEGGRPAPLDLGFALTTPMQFQSLTPDERRAFGTTLATQFNTTLEDLGFAQQQRFGPTRERPRAVLVPGFR